MNDYLGKAPLQTSIKTRTDSNSKFYGELNSVGKEHGRGIFIGNIGNICIGYFENGVLSTGNYITIHSDGKFWVGEYLKKDGKKSVRYTEYKTDGTE